jgi:hypothetical protein
MEVGGREEEREGEGKGREDEVIHRRWMRMFGRGENFEKRKKRKGKKAMFSSFGRIGVSAVESKSGCPGGGKKKIIR